MTEIFVSNRTELLSALNSANGGETIVLANGNYGEITLTNDYASYVTVTSANPLGAEFSKISLKGATNLHFDDVQVVGEFEAINNSEHIKLTNSDIDGLLYVKYVNDIVVDGNDIEGNFHAALLNNVTNFEVTNNVIHDAQVDLMRVTGISYGGLIENNDFLDTHPEDYRSEGGGYNHSDVIQMFGANGVTPHDIIIRGNHIYDDRSTGASGVTPQGIFMSDPAGDGGYKNMLIEDNLINVGSSNSIYINGGQENVVVQNNTLISSANDGGGVIRLAQKAGFDNSGTTVSGNIMKLLDDETRQSTIGDNYIYGRNADLDMLFSGDGSSREDFIPVSGSPIDFGTGYGAIKRLPEGSAVSSTGTESESSSIPNTSVEPPVEGPQSSYLGSAPVLAADGSLTVDASHYDLGGQGVAYNDLTSGVVDSKHATDEGRTGTDVEHTTGGDIGFVQAGEWLEYTIDIEQAGDYDLDLLMATTQGGRSVSAEFTLAGETSAYATTGLATPNTGNWSSYAPTEKATVALEAGEQVVRVKFNEGSQDIRSFTLTSVDSTELNNLFSIGGETFFSGSTSKAINVAHDESLEIDQGSIGFSFEADAVGWRRGLVSKDAGGTGDGFSAWIEDGTLMVRFESDSDTALFTQEDIKKDTAYDFLATFDNKEVKFYLDGELKGKSDLDMDWSDNDDILHVGAYHSGSSEPELNDVRYAYDGSITDLSIVDQVLTPETWDVA